MTLPEDPKVRAAAATFLKRLFDQADREDKAMPHIVLCFDPETGRRFAFGPYRNHFEARIAQIVHVENFRRDDLDDVTTELVILEPGLGKEAAAQ